MQGKARSRRVDITDASGGRSRRDGADSIRKGAYRAGARRDRRRRRRCSQRAAAERPPIGTIARCAWLGPSVRCRRRAGSGRRCRPVPSTRLPPGDPRPGLCLRAFTGAAAIPAQRTPSRRRRSAVLARDGRRSPVPAHGRAAGTRAGPMERVHRALLELRGRASQEPRGKRAMVAGTGSGPCCDAGAQPPPGSARTVAAPAPCRRACRIGPETRWRPPILSAVGHG